MRKMLIADDNKQIVTIMEEYARREGFFVRRSYDGEDALTLALTQKYDIILLDVMMPKKDGFTVCHEIRKSSTVPIIMVTARSEDFERIMGLNNGADDYVVKPFSPGEVMARVRAVLRRINREDYISDGSYFSSGSLSINLIEYITQINGAKIVLTKKETDILWTLVTNKNRVFSRESLLDSLWGQDYYGDSRTVDSHIKRLRAKLDEVDHSDWEIKTIWGIGYKFEDLT